MAADAGVGQAEKGEAAEAPGEEGGKMRGVVINDT